MAVIVRNAKQEPSESATLLITGIASKLPMLPSGMNCKDARQVGIRYSGENDGDIIQPLVTVLKLKLTDSTKHSESAAAQSKLVRLSISLISPRKINTSV